MKTRLYLFIVIVIPLLFTGISKFSKAETLRLKFDDTAFEIKNDTLYANRIPVALMVSEIKRIDRSRVLIVTYIK